MADQANPTDDARPLADGQVVASGSPAPHDAPRVVVDDAVVTVRVRRAPKYAVFLTLGAVLGVLVALILTSAFGGAENESSTGVVYSFAQVFGFLALIGIAVGVVVGGLVALIFDRVMSARAHDVTADRVRTRLVD